MRIAVRSLLIALATFATGCTTTYRMPNLPADKSQVALLLQQDTSILAKFFITEIDGVSRGFGNVNRFELLPGRRAVTGHINAGAWTGDDIVRYFTAEAGKEYMFIAIDDTRRQQWTFQIIEMKTGNRVDSEFR
jgi:hypothetical protein